MLVPTGEQFTAEAGEAVLTAALRAGLNLPAQLQGRSLRLLPGARAARATSIIHGRVRGHQRRGGIRTDSRCCARRMRSTDLRVEAREVRPAPDVEVKSLPCRVERLERSDRRRHGRVVLRLPAVETLQFRPGQYLDVMLPAGASQLSRSRMRRPMAALLELHVRRASSSGFTASCSTRMNRAPCCASRDRSGSSGCASSRRDRPLMIGGGTGYAPLRAMLRQLLADGDRRPGHAVLGCAHRSRPVRARLAGVNSTRTRPGFRYRAGAFAAGSHGRCA